MPPLLSRPLAVVLLLAGTTRADDWPQWMGPNRDGVWAESGVLTKFPATGPMRLWSIPVGGGYSGPAVAGDKVFVLDYHRADGDTTNSPAKRNELTGKERVLCVDAATGAKAWEHAYDCPYKVSYPAGPRCTPTVADGKVYALGAMGHLHCLTADSGKVVWSKDFVKDFAAPVPMWGFCGHPLVYKDLVVCLVGGDGTTAVAFDKDSGSEKWRALSSDETGYSPPTLIRVGDEDQVVVWHGRAVNGLEPRTGKVLWTVPLAPNYGMAIMAPRQSGNHLFAGGIMGKAALLKLTADPPAAEVAWQGTGKTALYPVNSTPLVDHGVMYGVDHFGALRAVEFDTGKRLWSTFKPVLGEEKDPDYTGKNSGTAFLVRNADRYFLFAETGELVVAKLTPEQYEEIDRAKLVEPTGEAFGRHVVWSHPAFAKRCVFVRNDRELACFSLAAE